MLCYGLNKMTRYATTQLTALTEMTEMKPTTGHEAPDICLQCV